MSLYAKQNGKNYYWKFRFTDVEGIIKSKSVNTGISKHGSKKEARRVGLLKEEEFKSTLSPPKIRHHEQKFSHADDTVAEFSHHWLSERIRYLNEGTKYYYKTTVVKHIIPIIGDIKLSELDQFDLEEFIDTHLQICSEKEELCIQKQNAGKRIKTNERPYYNSIAKIFNILSIMLTDAVAIGAIPENPAKKVSKAAKKKMPKSNFRGAAYTLNEHQALIEASKGNILEAPIMLAAYLGLRREEVLGLKWSQIDLDQDIVTVEDTVVTAGGSIIYQNDSTKTVASNDILPIIGPLHEFLAELKKNQANDQTALGEGYIDSDFVCRWPDGKLIKPNYISQNFKKFLRANNLREIRFHDLRDTVVTLVWQNTGDIKKAQAIARHANLNVTADIYTEAKLEDKKNGLERAFGINNLNNVD